MNRKVMLGTLILVALAIGGFMFSSGMTSNTNYLSEIDTLIAQGSYGEALSLVDRFTNDDPEYIQANLKKAQVQILKEEDPTDTLETILSMDPVNIEAWTLKGDYLKTSASKEDYYSLLLEGFEATKDTSFVEKINALKPLNPKLDKESGTYEQKVALTLTNFNENDKFYYSVNGNEFKQLRKDNLSYIKDTKLILYSENDLGLKSNEISYEFVIETFKKNLDLGMEAKANGDLINASTYLEKALSYSEGSETVLVALIDVYTELGEKNNLIRILDLANYHLKDEQYGEALKTLIPKNPSLSLEDGFYTGSQTITLNESDASVHYTTDGSDPSSTSLVWSEDLILNQGIHNIKVIAINSEGIASDIIDYYYEIDTPERNLYFSKYINKDDVQLIKRKLYDPSSKSEVVMTFNTTFKPMGLDLSPSGDTMISNMGYYNEDEKLTGSGIHYIDLEKQETELLYKAEGMYIKRAKFIDDKNIVFNSGKPGGDFGDQEIYSINVDTKVVTQLTDNNTSDTYAYPVGDKIVYEHRTEVNWSYSAEIFLMDADGSNKTNLINDKNIETVASMDFMPAPNHDLSKVAFTTFRFMPVDQGFTRQIGIVDLRDGKITHYAGLIGNYLITTWVDNDSFIYREYKEDRSSHIVLGHLDGTTEVLESCTEEGQRIMPLMYK